MWGGSDRRSAGRIALLALVGLALSFACAFADGRAPSPRGSRPAPAAGQVATASSRKAPPVLIGPTRVTLVSGRTIDAIAVLREPDRVRVILESGTEIDLEPTKVRSIEALADMEEPPPAQPAVTEVPGFPSARSAAGDASRKASSGAPGGRAWGGRPVGGGPGSDAAKSAKSAGKPTAGTARDVSAAAGASERRPTLKASGPGSTTEAARTTAGTPGTPGDGDKGMDARRAEEESDDVEEMAAMLGHAIQSADLEGPREPDLPESAPEGAESPDANPEGIGAPAETGGATASGAAQQEVRREPRPEDFDATRPIVYPGLRIIGKAGRVPGASEPRFDFPAPASPTVSLGPAWWRPKEGFSSKAKWPKSLDPPTSFSNELSGLGMPTTSLGPHYFTPKPVTWPSSIFPNTWQPTDGFAKKKAEP